ncbi:unnamed protein product [Vitrella brassicaformis CCMP3155]|uniref:Uncharacterized protein n=2 Tax=Vitrella brassicaformis TaxID=1169539 RepID=A0A0G4GY36_VITBC|nr:unnamed protein product [Vitrella brassicaformis CCMP3155]|eukprot:CEM35943.1 unnamed protein product [Vitrella brassicaformis CCMP3155]
MDDSALRDEAGGDEGVSALLPTYGGVSQANAPPMSLAPRHVFGLKSDVKNLLHFAEETQLIYPAGHNTVLYSIDHRTQKFFSGADETLGITAITISPSKRYVAVAERTETAIISIYDLVTAKKRRSLSYAECASHEYVSLCFSSENKFLLSLGGPPDWSLVYWSWDKAKVIASVKASNAHGAPLYECSVNPTDSTLAVVIGEGVFRSFRLQDGTLKPLPHPLSKKEPQPYTCHTWLSDDRLVVGTENGELLLFDNGGEFKMVLPCSPSEIRSALCMASYSKGFITGGEEGAIKIFEKSDDPKEVFRKTVDVKVENAAGSRVMGFAVSPSEEILAVGLSNSQLYQFSLAASDLLKSEEAPNLDFLLTSFHTGAVLGMDTCIRKPLMATCGADKTVRVWNYLEKTCELCKSFNEEAYSVAFHPSGFHLLVGFSDKLRLMNLLMEDLRPFKEIPIKACRECRFSNGGQYFAAANSNTIQVYKTYTCDIVANLRGHNSKVRSICWTADDMSIVSAGMDGAVYEYNIAQEGRRVSDWVQKGTSFSCVIVYTDPSAVGTPGTTTSANTMYVVGSDKMLKEIYNSQLGHYLEAGNQLGQIVLSNSAKTLFAAVAENEHPGPIRAYRFPLHGEYVEYQCHAGPCARLRITFDDMYLLSCSEDGTLYVFDIREKDRVVSKRDKESALPYADEILVTRFFLDEKEAALVELERQVEELTNQMDFQLRNRDSFHKEKMAELEDKYEHELEQERTRYELLREEKNDMETEYEENLKSIEEANAKSTQELEASFQTKMMIEVARYQKLATEREREAKAWEEKQGQIRQEHEGLITRMTEDFEEKKREYNNEMRNLIEQKELAFKTHQETLRQLEQDADREIEELKEQYEEKLANERDEKVRLRGQAGIHRKHHEDLKRQMEKNKEELKQKEEINQKLRSDIEKLMKDRDGMAKEIKERDKTIGDKEQRIYDLKKQNQELEKFKFVLDYKIKELKAQIDPKNEDIAEMKRHIQAMDAELEDYHRKNKQLAMDISQLQMKQRALQEEITSQRKKLTDYQHFCKQFRNDLYDCAQHIQEPKQLKDAIASLYRKYVTQEVKKVELDADIQKEYNRQRDYLEKSVESLKRKLAKDSEVHRQDNMKVMQENVSLIREINDLRREINYLKHERQQARLNATQQAFHGKTRQRTGAAAQQKGATAPAGVLGVSHEPDAEATRMLEVQREEIDTLRRRVNELELTTPRAPPTASERLPSIHHPPSQAAPSPSHTAADQPTPQPPSEPVMAPPPAEEEEQGGPDAADVIDQPAAFGEPQLPEEEMVAPPAEEIAAEEETLADKETTQDPQLQEVGEVPASKEEGGAPESHEEGPEGAGEPVVDVAGVSPPSHVDEAAAEEGAERHHPDAEEGEGEGEGEGARE